LVRPWSDDRREAPAEYGDALAQAIAASDDNPAGADETSSETAVRAQWRDGKNLKNRD